jgi:ankyrin repeat protein
MWHMVNILLKRGTVVDAPSDLKTPLQISASFGSVKCAEALLAAGANSDAKCKRAPQSALGRAAFRRHGKVVKLVLEYGADVDLADGFGCTPLMWAAGNVHFDICKDLLDHHADMNVQSMAGSNAVTKAAHYGHEEIVNLLLKRGTSGAPPRALSGKWKESSV